MKLTKQTIFNKVWNHFIVKKGKASFSSEMKQCLYRGPNGAKCAIGVLIPDSVYEPKMEKFGNLSGLIMLSDKFQNWAKKDLDKSVTEFNYEFLFKLQLAHDELAVKNLTDKEFTGRYKEKLLDIAHMFKLKVQGKKVK